MAGGYSLFYSFFSDQTGRFSGQRRRSCETTVSFSIKLAASMAGPGLNSKQIERTMHGRRVFDVHFLVNPLYETGTIHLDRIYKISRIFFA
jgi:hypothetical protein